MTNSYSSLMMEAARTSETSVDNHFTRQYNPEDSSERQCKCLQQMLKPHIGMLFSRKSRYFDAGGGGVGVLIFS
jgi:hypothetical protein